jgi:hypothetical protein
MLGWIDILVKKYNIIKYIYKMITKNHKITMATLGVLLISLILILMVQPTSLENFTLQGESIDSVDSSEWVADAKAYNNSMKNNKRSNYNGTEVPLAKDSMFYFKDNKFLPECCPATYSSSTGCACMSDAQLQYLNERGGNRTASSNY